MPELDLDGIRAKLDRAHVHLKALQAEIPVFFARDPYEVGMNLDCKAGKCSVHIEVREHPPLAWSVMVGDIVHNLRSALDHLAWQLVLVSGAEPVIGATQFPIFTSEPGNSNERGKWNRYVAGMADPILEYMREVQPYADRDGAHEHSLVILATFSNEDKHRLPAARVAAVAEHEVGSIGLVPVRDVEVSNAMIVKGIPLEDGDQIAWAEILCTGPEPDVDLKGPVPMDIAFSAGSNHVPMQGLVDLCKHAVALVNAFEALCREADLTADVD